MTLANDLASPVPAPAERPAVEKAPGGRVASVDAFRGLAMLLMASEGLGITRVAAEFPNSRIWQVLAQQTSHVQWVGCALWDLIQPSFMFIVGVALPFSIAARAARGQSFGRMLMHAVFRALLLIWLGIFLRSVGRSQTYYTFEDVLTQIGLGYVFLFLLAWTRPRAQLIAAAVILVGYWGAFALWPAPEPGTGYATAELPRNWPALEGFAAHWDKNTNLAAAADQWFLNQYPRIGGRRFTFNAGGYQTLNFVPSLATMIFGLLAGGLLRSTRPPVLKFVILVLAGVLGLAAGWALGAFGICPIVKRIWTPSWAIFAGGWTFLALAVFYLTIDMPGWKRWAFPLIVVGTNSLAMYVMAHLFDSFIQDSFRTHFGPRVFEIFSPAYAPMVASATVLVILWLICLWLYRQRVFIRI